MVSVALHLSNDFVTDEFPEKYDYLPQSANRFTAALLMAIGKAYKNTCKLLDTFVHVQLQGYLKLSIMHMKLILLSYHEAPPKQLIIQVANWIESTPRVCLIPLLSSVFGMIFLAHCIFFQIITIS